MNPYTGMISAWGLVTASLLILLVYRMRLTSHESDWIHMTNDPMEDRAIQTQKVIDSKAQKLTWPIRSLGILSVVMLLVIVGFWLYQGFTTPPPLMTP